MGSPWPGGSLFWMLLTCRSTTSRSLSIQKGYFKRRMEGTKSAQKNLQAPPLGMGRGTPTFSGITPRSARQSKSLLHSPLHPLASLLMSVISAKLFFEILPSRRSSHRQSHCLFPNHLPRSWKEDCPVYSGFFFPWTSQAGTKFVLLLQGTWENQESRVRFSRNEGFASLKQVETNPSWPLPLQTASPRCSHWRQAQTGQRLLSRVPQLPSNSTPSPRCKCSAVSASSINKLLHATTMRCLMNHLQRGGFFF